MTKEKNPFLGKERLEMFCDGVFAIAITLLVLEIKIPKHEEVHAAGGLYAYLKGLWPNYVSYIVTFISIGIYWSNHHWMLSFITKTNHIFNLLSILFLMTIAFMPFTNAVFADYILDPENKSAAVTIYCLGYLFPIPAVIANFAYAVSGHRLVDKKLSPKFIRSCYIKLFSGFMVGILATVLSLKYPLISILLIIVAFIVYLLPPESPVLDHELK